MICSKNYKSGLRLIVKEMQGVFSVTCGILVGTGSAYESKKENGISHFIEHMMFKGTSKRTSFEISDAMDRIGAQANAFTAKEITCYYSKSTKEHVEKSFEILSDLFINSTFPADEAEKEKTVVLEEIAMSEDTPDDLCLDLLSRAYYGNDNFGQDILGTSDNVKGFSRENILEYINERYSPDNVVISVAGNISFDEADKLVERYVEPFMRKRETRPRNVTVAPKYQVLARKKDIEQVHIAVAYPSVCREHELFESTQLLNTVLGGGMSSRLFQRVREELGLAYSVYSFSTAYNDCGTMAIYAGVNEKNAALAMSEIYKTIDEIKRSGITDDEFVRGKEQLKAQAVFSQESSSSQMLLYGRYLINTGNIYDFDDKIARVNNLTKSDIERAIAFNFDEGKLAASFVGKNDLSKDIFGK